MKILLGVSSIKTINNPSFESQKPNHDVLNAFVPFYYTLISIIQGVSLGILLQQIVQNFSGINLCYAIVVGYFLVESTYEYMTTSVFYRWPLNIFDILIPLTIGCGIILMALFIHFPNKIYFWMVLFVMPLLGMIAYVNILNKFPEALLDELARHPDKDREFFFRWVETFPKNISAFFKLFLFTIMGFIVFRFLSWDVLGLIFVGVGGIIVTKKENAWLELVYQDHGVGNRVSIKICRRFFRRIRVK